jgi:hypothetical protein
VALVTHLLHLHRKVITAVQLLQQIIVAQAAVAQAVQDLLVELILQAQAVVARLHQLLEHP